MKLKILIVAITIVHSQTTPTSPQQFHFYPVPQGIAPYGTLDVTKTPTLTFTWQFDTCAGSVDGGGNPVANPRSVNGQCVDGNGKVLAAANDAAQVFPKGFTSLYFIRGFSLNGTRIDLLQSNVNTPQLAGSTKQVTIPVASLQSDYYSLVMSATDILGQSVQGASAPIALTGNGALPVSNAMTLHSPQPNSYWLASRTYRIRFEVSPNGFIPPAYNLDLLTPSGAIIMRVLQATYPIAGDTLYGPGRLLNYTVWSIPPELANRAFKVRVTGVGFDGNVVSTPEGAPVAESGVFYVGPAIG